MKKYFSFFRIQFVNGLQYRTAAYAGVVTQFAWGMMEVLMFRAFYISNPASFPMEFSALSSYIWLQQALLAMFNMWSMDKDIFSSISQGTIAYELSRPLDIYTMWMSKTLSARFSQALLRAVPILLISPLLPKPYGLSLPAGGLNFLLFLVTFVFGAVLVAAFCMLIYISAFYTISPMGVRAVMTSVTEFMTGALIPLPMFPDKVRRLLELTPFACMQNVPLRIYSGNISGREMLQAVALQLFWLCVLIGVGKLWMKRALRKVVVQGG